MRQGKGRCVREREVGDDELLRRLVNGSVEEGEEAFELLFERHAELVYGVAFRRTGVMAAAEDIVAEVFLDLWRRRSEVRVRSSSLRPWLVGAASNQAKRFWRSDHRQRSATDKLRGTSEAGAVESDPGEEITERMSREARALAVLEALEALPGGQRDVLMLWVWEELSYGEIAEALDLPIGTVRSRLARARTRLDTIELPDGCSEHLGAARRSPVSSAAETARKRGASG